MQTMEGQVVKRPFAVGTKSERLAHFLVTTGGDYLLRRPATNAFELDPEFESLEGQQIRASGTLSGYTFFVSDWEKE